MPVGIHTPPHIAAHRALPDRAVKYKYVLFAAYESRPPRTLALDAGPLTYLDD